MKSGLFLFLISGALVGIAGAATDAPVAAGNGSTFEEFLCTLSQPAAMVAPDSASAPRQTSVTICGACSSYHCANRNVGAYCHDLRQGWGTCYDPYMTTCGDGTPMCQCVFGDPL